MRTLAAAAALFLTLFGSGMPKAQTLGSELIMQCENPNTWEQTMCVTYLRGVWDGAVTTGITTNAPAFCPPAKQTVIADQMRRMFINWANKNPRFLSYSSGSNAVAAFRENFPCLSPSDEPTPRTSKKKS
jgi:hypothetical protein